MRQIGSQHDCKQSRESSLYTGEMSCTESTYNWPAAQLSQTASCHHGRLCNHASDLLQQALLNVCVVDMAELSHIHSQLPLLLLCEHPLIMRAPCMAQHFTGLPYHAMGTCKISIAQTVIMCIAQGGCVSKQLQSAIFESLQTGALVTHRRCTGQASLLRTYVKRPENDMAHLDSQGC